MGWLFSILKMVIYKFCKLFLLDYCSRYDEGIILNLQTALPLYCFTETHSPFTCEGYLVIIICKYY